MKEYGAKSMHVRLLLLILMELPFSKARGEISPSHHAHTTALVRKEQQPDVSHRFINMSPRQLQG